MCFNGFLRFKWVLWAFLPAIAYFFFGSRAQNASLGFYVTQSDRSSFGLTASCQKPNALLKNLLAVNTSNSKSLEKKKYFTWFFSLLNHENKQELGLITDSDELIDNPFGRFDRPIREEVKKIAEMPSSGERNEAEKVKSNSWDTLHALSSIRLSAGLKTSSQQFSLTWFTEGIVQRYLLAWKREVTKATPTSWALKHRLWPLNLCYNTEATPTS